MIAALRSDDPDRSKSVGVALFLIFDQHLLAGSDQSVQPSISPLLGNKTKPGRARLDCLALQLGHARRGRVGPR